MKYLELKSTINSNIFNLLDIAKFFPKEKEQNIKIQLYRFYKKQYIHQIKRGLYCFDPSSIDEFELANKLYKPSYISLESALNYYQIIPDIPQAVTSICPARTKTYKNRLGTFYYHQVKSDLFFAYTKVNSADSSAFFNIATAEKALLDYFYIRKITNTKSLRLNTKAINQNKYQALLKNYPLRIKKIVL